MWDTLQLTHEGITDVKRSRINIVTHEYELFRMNTNENIQSMQKRFTHIVNHLASLGKIFPNEDLINKVLRCLSKEWQPKETAISESKDLSSMSLATLFGKLQEHVMELQRLNQNEETDKRKQSIALKASSSIQEEEDDEDFSLFCNQLGHIKANCPSNEQWPEKNEKKSHEERRYKKAYIAWDDNDSSDGSKKEINLLSKDYESDENIPQED
ncbi:hypothetical protein HKD37_01G000889 [Glycine soja]